MTRDTLPVPVAGSLFRLAAIHLGSCDWGICRSVIFCDGRGETWRADVVFFSDCQLSICVHGTVGRTQHKSDATFGTTPYGEIAWLEVP